MSGLDQGDRVLRDPMASGGTVLGAPAPVDPPGQVSSSPRPRLAVVDVARGAALLAMASYHTVWDLGYLRLTPQNYALTPLGKSAAHGIAGTFLVLVGIGLVLMNRDGFRTRSYLLRLVRIAVSALLITLATAYAFPDSYIFFGILHCIALSSVLAVPFLFLPTAFAVLAAALVFSAPFVVAAPVLDAPVLTFLGLGAQMPRTNDYVPLFPWFGFVLAGLAAARLAWPVLDGSAFARWPAKAGLARLAALAGRHSLGLYLVHQPVLLALLTGLVTLTGPHPRAGFVEFRADYFANCTRTGGDARACRIAARCVSEALVRENLWAVGERSFTVPERLKAQGLSQGCYDAADATVPSP